MSRITITARDVIGGTNTKTIDYSVTSPTNLLPGEPPPGTLLYGATTQGDDPAVLENQLGGGRRLESFRVYQQPNSSLSDMRGDMNRVGNRLGIISLKCPNNGDVAGFINGNYDSWFIDRLNILQSYDAPVWLCIHHEPNDNMTSTQYRQLQQRCRALKETNLGVTGINTKVVQVAILNSWDFLKPAPNPEWGRHTDGAEIFGYDVYNPWFEGGNKKWRPVDEALLPARTIINDWGEKTFVGEWGVRHDPISPNKAADWIREFYEKSKTTGVLSLNYFFSGLNSPNGTWTFSGTDARNQAFRDCLDDSVALKA